MIAASARGLAQLVAANSRAAAEARHTKLASGERE
jgi:hypothetical protein